jgi:hypothetical protein
VIDPGPQTINSDIVEISSGVVRVVWSTTLGEEPPNLRMAELNLGNGQVRYAQVVGSAFVFGTFSTLTQVPTPVQIVGGSTGSQLQAAVNHPVTDPRTGGRITLPWEGYLRDLDRRITGGIPASSITGVLQPSQGGTGQQSGVTDLDAGNLTMGTVPQARKWTEITVTPATDQNDLGFQDADFLRVNAAAAVAITGLVAGVPGQRLLIAAVGAGGVTIVNEFGGSSAANRIITNFSGTLTLLGGSGMALLTYDGTTARWRVMQTASAAVVPLSGRWSPLTNGDPLKPELIFDADGDVIDVFITS